MALPASDESNSAGSDFSLQDTFAEKQGGLLFPKMGRALGVCRYALGTRRQLWFGHGCNGKRMLLEHERDYGLDMDAKDSVCSWNTKDVIDRMFSQQEGDYGLGMDVKVTACSSNRKEIMVWACMQRTAYVLGTQRMLWSVWSCSTKEIIVWAWM